MSVTDLLGTIQFTEQIRGGTEPAVTITYDVDADGFHDAGGVGRAGQESGVVDVAEVAAALTTNLPAAQLRVLLGHFVRLHDQIARGGG
jgi:hypothetical protein